MARSRLRRLVDLLRRTPLHPQWLLGPQTATVARLKAVATGRVIDIGCADRWVERKLPSVYGDERNHAWHVHA